jgi:small redox-active disulfide protein 2
MENSIEKVIVYGSGCESCKKLFDSAQKAVSNLGMNVQVEYVDDIGQIIGLGFMSFPVMMINDEPMVIGKVLDVGEVEEVIKRYMEGKGEKEESTCSCGGNC